MLCHQFDVNVEEMVSEIQQELNFRLVQIDQSRCFPLAHIWHDTFLDRKKEIFVNAHKKTSKTIIPSNFKIRCQTQVHQEDESCFHA